MEGENMQNILNFFSSGMYSLIITGVILILFVLYITNSIKLSKLRSSYKQFMKKLGNGDSIDEMLKKRLLRNWCKGTKC